MFLLFIYNENDYCEVNMVLKKKQLVNHIDSSEDVNVKDLEAENEYMIRVLEKIVLHHEKKIKSKKEVKFDCEEAKMSNILSDYNNMIKKEGKFLNQEVIKNGVMILLISLFLLVFNSLVSYSEVKDNEIYFSFWVGLNYLIGVTCFVYLLSFIGSFFCKIMNLIGKRKKVVVVIENKRKGFIQKMLHGKFEKLSLFKFGMSNLSEISAKINKMLIMRYFRITRSYSQDYVSISLVKNEKGKYVLPSLQEAEKELQGKLKKSAFN